MINIYQNIIPLLLSARTRLKSILTVFIFFGLTLIFSTCIDDYEIAPTLNTLQPVDSNITATTAILKGDIQIVGNMLIIEYGIEISKSMLFSPSLKKGFTTTPVKGVYQVEFTDLEPNTLYYYRAYALINTAYINSQTAAHFTTKLP
jgi:hypothetical protein